MRNSSDKPFLGTGEARRWIREAETGAKRRVVMTGGVVAVVNRASSVKRQAAMGRFQGGCRVGLEMLRPPRGRDRGANEGDGNGKWMEGRERRQRRDSQAGE